jgi:hypothetical protein
MPQSTRRSLRTARRRRAPRCAARGGAPPPPPPAACGRPRRRGADARPARCAWHAACTRNSIARGARRPAPLPRAAPSPARAACGAQRPPRHRGPTEPPAAPARPRPGRAGGADAGRDQPRGAAAPQLCNHLPPRRRQDDADREAGAAEGWGGAGGWGEWGLGWGRVQGSERRSRRAPGAAAAMPPATRQAAGTPSQGLTAPHAPSPPNSCCSVARSTRPARSRRAPTGAQRRRTGWSWRRRAASASPPLP